MTGLPSEGQVVLWGLMLVCTVTTGTAQLKVSACIGNSVLLPCIYDVSSQPVSVFWRDEDNRVVLDIKQNVPNNSTQDGKFSGRVFSHPELYRKGNFSVTMRDVLPSDSGLYDCVFPALSDRHKVSLTVSERCDKAAATPPPSSPAPPGASGGGAAVTPTCFIFLLTPPLLHCLTASSFL
ncbi:CD276 antigen homolog [Epinephelus fuscoguttatus]|uniref:CD276 antigen homolog n=1 Tax=Epinephelus fuscoguttatus TaxID=293821 RepID=UPI0020D102C8|nr:CD276 antigen homolog [Epinephelus fuscoguttatus]